jgi:carboxyl-terminal processing protease
MNKTLRNVLIVFVALVLIVCSFGGGLAAGRGSLKFLPSSSPSVQTQTSGNSTGGTPSDLQTTFTPFWQAWDLIHQNYVDQPVDNTTLMQGAIRGMMQSLGDAHTIYLNPQEYTDATTQMTGSYAGIGAYVDTNSDFLTIVRPIVGSPAEKAGLQSGDKIIAVDGTDMTGVTPTVVRQKVLGTAGTDVKLTIQRGNAQPFDVTITRATITIPSVESKMLDNNIAYIKLSVFGDNTAQDFKDQLAKLMAQNPKGLILDLRDNTGGLLTTAITVASQFIPSGVIVYEQSGDGTKKAYNVESGGLATKVPMVVLINGFSASASEIVSGAIQDSGRGKLVGEKSYGKGTVQYWIPLSDSQGAVAITIARWLTPNGRTIDKLGLTPDVPVTMTQADYTAGKDPQLDAAVKQLLQP